MTVKDVAKQFGLWEQLVRIIAREANREGLVELIGCLPVRRSSASTRLGSYLSRGAKAVSIRLQFSQEQDLLAETLLHEIAHACDHQDNQTGKNYRGAHGAGWQAWMKAFGLAPRCRGRSEELRRIYRQRLKVVAVCNRCGLEIHRLRRLNSRRRYLHADCGGALLSV